MKIGFVLDDTLDVADGVQQAVITTGEHLKHLGHDVHYITSCSYRKDITNVHSFVKLINVRFNGNKMRIPLPANKKKIKKFLNEHNFDVLHVQMPYSPLFAEKVLLSANKRTKIVGTFHILPYSKLSVLSGYILGMILRRSLARIDHLIAVSSPAAEFCNQIFKVNAEVIPNPINISQFKVKPQPPVSKYKRIVFLGRLVRRKGAVELLEAYNLLLKTQPDLIATTELVIAGEGELKNELLDKAKLLPQGAKVEFLGFIEEEDKPNLLNSADIAAFPSLGGESFGIVLVEAMASGAKNIIAGNNPGYSSVLGHYPELLVDPKNTKEFADKLRVFLSIDDYKISRDIDFEAECKKYDIDVVCKKLLGLYNS